VSESELKGVTVAVVGGDLRMLEHMRLARAAGATVQHYGSVPGAEEAAGRPQAASLAEAVKGAKIISCPIPGVGTDGSLFAKYTSETLLMTPDVLQGAVPGALMFTYCDTPQLIEWAKGTPVEVIGYGEDDELCILHAIPTAEGAIKLAIENTDETLLGMPVLCFGLGRIGMSVAQAFDAMKARVTLTARNPAQLARAEAMGLKRIPLSNLLDDLDQLARFSLLVSSSSGRVVTREMIVRTRADVLIMDLCSPPGSVDFDAAKELGRRVIWGRAQAGSAPRSAGAHEWQVLMRFVRARMPQIGVS
jgi:dipicolinate synthase subunit A